MESKKPDEDKRPIPPRVEDRPPEQRAPRVGEYAADVKSTGRYRLLAQHLYAGDRLLDPGTEVGTDTPYPWPDRPSPLMEGVDDAGKAEVEKLHKELYNRLPPWHFRNTPEYEIHEERRKEQENETESDPVSHVQAMERGKEWKGPVPVPATSIPSIGGVRTGGLSLPAVNVENPNEEQYPKG